MMTRSTLPALLLLLLWQLFSTSVALEQDEESRTNFLRADPKNTLEEDDSQKEEELPVLKHHNFVDFEDDAAQYHEHTGELRRLQASSFFPADDPYWNPAGVMERKPCIPFDMIRFGQINNANADGTCASNSCGGGCCRAYNWLLCDSDSSFAYVSCVCNENTWPPDQWTKAPTIPPPGTRSINAPEPAPPSSAPPTAEASAPPTAEE